ncbi:hypothetical protein GCM10022222_69110 [Amycolatopsis ultiminotia]|uniref:Uncharacterized protein n=1 Tax=Amycolatopsis ultiminotia TaxID=543629 RepID=A0ABP6XZ95_9PSEU
MREPFGVSDHVAKIVLDPAGRLEHALSLVLAETEARSRGWWRCAASAGTTPARLVTEDIDPEAVKPVARRRRRLRQGAPLD